MDFILDKRSDRAKIARLGGGKALNLYLLEQANLAVPPFIVLSNSFFQEFKRVHDLDHKIGQIHHLEQDANRIQELFTTLDLTDDLKQKILTEMKAHQLDQSDVAVRSSGLDEDSSDHSFAGMFSSFLFVKQEKDLFRSIVDCWASAYSHRCLEYRVKNHLSTDQIGMGVVIQKMVDSSSSGVMFSRNPIDHTDHQTVLIESVLGQCEALVSGLLEADVHKYNRKTGDIESKAAEKEFQLVRKEQGSGLEKIVLQGEEQKKLSLSAVQVKEVGLLGVKVEEYYQRPMDIEWAYEKDQLYLVQARPITTLPGLGYFEPHINGDYSTLWDNSNIVESFAGVTSPLTFSLTKDAYAVVYQVTCRLLGVPESVIAEYRDAFDNMLGHVRGRVYYNLINWYRLLFLVPGSGSNQGFMETMMGVKQELDEKQQELFNFVDQIPQYSVFKKIEVLIRLGYKFLTLDRVVQEFSDQFDSVYQRFLKKDFKRRNLEELKNDYLEWNNQITYNWKAPIINDFLVMFFFGVLKKLTEKWIKTEKVNLQNDLLCGQGDLDSTLPTITLMKMAQKFDQNEDYRALFLENDQVERLVMQGDYPEIKNEIDLYLKLYGFRCNNEQKLEEEDLTTNPSFVFDALKGYIRSKKYDVEAMKRNEENIKKEAESEIGKSLSGIKKSVFFWVLKHARATVRNRENMRFLRSKSFGITRKIFRAINEQLYQTGVLEKRELGFYLTYREIVDFIDGKAESMSLNAIAKTRECEYQGYWNEDDPPDRFFTYGAAGVSFQRMETIRSGDLLKNKIRISDDPNLVYGVSCCPGSVTGVVRVAPTIEDAKDLNGEILITKRTDPGWVPLFPNCAGLIIERGSLLSHSAVIARELGIPTIVGTSINVLKKFENGQKVELDATKGEIRILSND
jgi:pyruvate,water dikinase